MVEVKSRYAALLIVAAQRLPGRRLLLCKRLGGA